MPRSDEPYGEHMRLLAVISLCATPYLVAILTALLIWAANL